MADPRRFLPSMTALLERTGFPEGHPCAWAAKEASRLELDAERQRIGDEPEGKRARAWAEGPDSPAFAAALEALEARVRLRAERLAAPHPRRVVNATGVVLHTNLGRAPLALGAAHAALDAAGYSDLELDLETGGRGNRMAPLARRLELLTGAPAAMACNNCAAGLLLALNTIAAGREVIVSRGELVEIGGSFRVPSIMERAGVRLVEVGTTNRTHPRDYEDAIGPETALLLKVHRSNFEQRGFVKEVALPELAEIAARHHLPVVDDLGSGSLVDLRPLGLPDDTWVPGRLEAGADLVCVSGDKLLGGPQAGIVLGREDLVGAMRRNPLARALRLDKLGLAALDWTLGAMLAGRADRELPVLRQLSAEPASLERRARELAAKLEVLPGVEVGVAAVRSPVGGGSVPGFELDSWAVAVRRAGADPSGPDPSPSGWAERAAARLRAAPVPVIVRVRDGALWLDLRTVDESDEPELLAAASALAAVE